MKNITLKSVLVLMACSSVLSLAAIPEMRITTQNSQEVKPTCSGMEFNGMCMGTTTMKYIKVTEFKLTDPNNSRNNLTLTPEPAPSESDSIRVRGNSTAGIGDKRPYRIKFDKKQSLFGREKAKSWVLLANYYDQTLTLNAIAFRLGQKLGLAYTPSSQHVNLYINGSYKGIYQLTEQIQVNPGRVDVDTLKGFLVEFDYHDPESDEVKFTSAKYSLPVFIKSPEVTSSFNANNSKIKWVKDTIDLLTNKMSENGFPTNGYRDMIDLESYAKYVLIQQLIDNFDFNSKVPDQSQYGLPGSNFAYKDAGTRIYAGPLWDFDLAAGVTSSGAMSFNPHYSSTTEPIKPKHAFYQRLWDDPVFLAKFKKLWDKHQSDFNAIPAFIDSLANALKDNVANNKCANPSNLLGGAITLTTQTYNTEVGKLKTWWNSRMSSFGQQITSMNIDTSKDIEQTQPSSSSRPSPSSSSQLSSSSSSPSSSSRLSSSSSRSSSSSGGTTPVFGHSQPQQHGLFVRGRIVNIYTQEPSSVKLSVFDLRGKTLFSGNLGTGSNITWSSEGLGISKMLIVVVEAKGESGRTYKFSGRILP